MKIVKVSKVHDKTWVKEAKEHKPSAKKHVFDTVDEVQQRMREYAFQQLAKSNPSAHKKYHDYE